MFHRKCLSHYGYERKQPIKPKSLTGLELSRSGEREFFLTSGDGEKSLRSLQKLISSELNRLDQKNEAHALAMKKLPKGCLFF